MFKILHTVPSRRRPLVHRWHTRCFFLLTPLVLFCGSLPACSQRGNNSWDGVKAGVRGAYPSVPHVTVDELHDRLQGGAKIFVIDAREPDEYAVSHLKGAKQASHVQDAVALVEAYDASVPLVIYCSVGYRSAALAEGLLKSGFTNVANLEGSIFEWGNSGFPVYRGTQAVNVIHPFNQKWGRLMDADLRWSRP